MRFSINAIVLRTSCIVLPITTSHELHKLAHHAVRVLVIHLDAEDLARLAELELLIVVR